MLVRAMLSDRRNLKSWQKLSKVQPAMEAVRNGRTQIIPQNWENTYFQ